MTGFLFSIIFFLLGLAIGSWWQYKKFKISELAKQDEILVLNRELAQKSANLIHLEAAVTNLSQEKQELKLTESKTREEMFKAQSELQVLATQKELLEEKLRSLKDYMEDSRKQSRIEFENVANQILVKKVQSFEETTQKNLDAILNPLKEKIGQFESTVMKNYSEEAKERHTLKSEIDRLVSLNGKMAQETQSLTQALRGDSKVQGDWGELVLERILEVSGLREGHEFIKQKGHENSEGERFRPDIIVNLPENKHIVIDSKVSLKSFEQYRGTEDPEVQKRAMLKHLESIENHFLDLESKHYSKLKGLHSPEFVFMFVPVESAYMFAMKEDPELSTRAWKRGVALVTATTLLTGLKTVASIWRLEKQNKNALEIASEGAKLYDKFVGFLDDFEKIGKTFDSGSRLYSEAMGKLKTGPGNVFRKMETLKELGASPSKKLKSEYLES